MDQLALEKTTFAKSLPGSYNYFNGQWRLNDYNDTARYSIYDNIGWDRFEEYGYPNKKRILTQDGRFNVCDIFAFIIPIDSILTKSFYLLTII